MHRLLPAARSRYDDNATDNFASEKPSPDRIDNKLGYDVAGNVRLVHPIFQAELKRRSARTRRKEPFLTSSGRASSSSNTGRALLGRVRVVFDDLDDDFKRETLAKLKIALVKTGGSPPPPRHVHLCRHVHLLSVTFLHG